MRSFQKKLFFAFAVFACAILKAQSMPDVSSQDKIYSIFDIAKDSIVKVYAQKAIVAKDKDGKDIPAMTLDVGTGFIISKDGVVMTSAYVTHSADKIWIEWKGVLLSAQKVGFDPLTTLSIIKVAGDFKKYDAPVIHMDNTAQLPRVATIVMSISCEMGLPPSPRIGFTTGNNIEFGGTFLPTIYVRTNIPAPRGSTGGAIFDMSGKFVGMTIASLPEVSGSFILPARAAAKIRDDILLCGEPVYSWFGLRADDTEYNGKTKVVISLVVENAPAKKAGFLVGDEIVEINSKRVTNNTELRECTFFVRPGETTNFKIKRGDKNMNFEVVAERMPSDIISGAEKNIAKKNGNSSNNSVQQNALQKK